MANSGEQVCPVCGVKIIPMGNTDRVIFSTGGPGSRAKLWARVCSFVNRPGCINQDQQKIGQINMGDYYSPNAPATPEP
jgi:hypothetical protein